jgi:prolyl-tRNA editing enzyme YbaK/EbsC (Cys-tRNA(Pro) deacylase)
MLDHVVKYLRSHDVPFRLFSHPSPEALPAVAYRLPPGGVMVETHVLLVAGRPAIACMTRGSRMSLPRLKAELGADVLEGTAEDLPPPYTGVAGPTPPLGSALGVLTIVDEAVAAASSVAFEAFASSDVVEIPYDDFARLERPRVGSFSVGGELPENTEAGEPERKVA